MATEKKGGRAKKADKGPAVPSAADRKAQAEQQVPIEAIGPGVEHEDHEGGITDSLAQKGVRAALPTAEEKEEQRKEDIKKGIVRAPSVRERQTGMAAALAQGGFAGVRETATAEEQAKKGFVGVPRGAAATLAAREGSEIIPVIATRVGQYPADGRLRMPGEAFDYVKTAAEDKLPSWMKDARGELESRVAGEPSAAAPESVLVEVTGSGDNATATVTRGRSRSVL